MKQKQHYIILKINEIAISDGHIQIRFGSQSICALMILQNGHVYLPPYCIREFFLQNLLLGRKSFSVLYYKKKSLSRKNKFHFIVHFEFSAIIHMVFFCDWEKTSTSNIDLFMSTDRKTVWHIHKKEMFRYFSCRSPIICFDVFFLWN